MFKIEMLLRMLAKLFNSVIINPSIQENEEFIEFGCAIGLTCIDVIDRIKYKKDRRTIDLDNTIKRKHFIVPLQEFDETQILKDILSAAFSFFICHSISKFDAKFYSLIGLFAAHRRELLIAPTTEYDHDMEYNMTLQLIETENYEQFGRYIVESQTDFQLQLEAELKLNDETHLRLKP